MIELDNTSNHGARIRVVGVGGGGGNAINSMIDRGLNGVDFVSINTDLQALDRSTATYKIQVGKNLTRGLGTGADSTLGHRAVEENREDISRVLVGSDMVFIAAGMGGGTGTGGAPIVANIAKSIGALVVAIVTKPFNCEGKKRMTQAEWGIEELKKNCDTLIIVPNEKLLTLVDRKTPLLEAFELANTVLFNATRGISELITVPGVVNVDFADVRTVMREMGDAIMGSGVATGESRATEAAHNAMSNPLLEGISIAGAQGILINITAGPSLALAEVEEAVKIIGESAGDEGTLIFGAVIDERMTDDLMVTVIATGFNRKVAPKTPKTLKPLDRIPTGPSELKVFDRPAFERKGFSIHQNMNELERMEREKISKEDPEKPAFLRKIMD
ncbi:MAG: cell division protein FtsZ [Ignavibacteriales bacterium CG07_land_8_20_14_0_80_59_12]|nr:MAG: cell division protein FtsZ [Ignavibacteriales bacterium CG07_land_8_20_14_0_80_59_12]